MVVKNALDNFEFYIYFYNTRIARNNAAQPSLSSHLHPYESEKIIKARALIDKTLLLEYMMTRSVKAPVKGELSYHLFTSTPNIYIYRYLVTQIFNTFSTICTVRWLRIKARTSKAKIIF